MAYSKNKRVVTIFIVLLFLFLVLFPSFIPRHYAQWCTNLVAPLIQRLHKTTQEVYETVQAVLSIRQLMRENQELTIKIQQLIRDINNLKEISIENKSLKKLLAFKEEVIYETVPAKVVGRDATNWYESMVVDKGKDDGITVDMPVVSYDGVIGKVIEVTSNNAIIILLTDKKSKIGGIIQESRYAGIIEGAGKSLCRMNYILKDAELKPGEVVISSGFGGVYPKGMRIGAVTQIYQEEYGLYKYADVEPFVDFHRLEEVLIIVKEK